MAVHKQRKDGKLVYVDDSVGDALTNPEFSCECVPVTDDEGTVLGQAVLNWMAFQKRYGPESQEQIDWHLAHGTPGAEKWEVGVPLV